ncbi:MAG: MBG domain-containing protein [Veillonellales bacterium]
MRMTRKNRRRQERRRLREEKRNAIMKPLKNIAVTAALMVALSTGEALAMPQGGTVTAGNAAITQNANSMTIAQTTDKAAINWQNFSIAANEKVTFNQPSSSSVALNRIIGSNASDIFGQLQANGKVFLVNPNGILFAPGSKVNVGGLVASTLGISDSDFMSGKNNFSTGAVSRAVVNQGNITAADGGFVVLLGNQASNSGSITANGGTAAMAAGGQVFLDVPGDGTVSLVVNQGAVNAAVNNSGTVQANGGQAILTGQASSSLLSSVINNSGRIEAHSIRQQNGTIILDGGTSGVVETSGTLDASGKEAGQTGGTVKVLGEKVALSGQAQIDVSGSQGGGTALVGGNYQGKGPEANATAAYIGKDTTIKADAIDKGDGGKAIVWSNEATNFYGGISAKGGSQGGNGGLVETSGKEYLDAQGTVNAAAPKGKAGKWLLDPRDVIIETESKASASGTAGEPSFVAVSDSAVVTTESINLALNGGTNVSVNTGTSGTQTGNITIADNITKATGGDATLSLSAASNIIVNSGVKITSTSNNLNVDFNADSDNVWGGTIQLQSDSQILTNGGNIDLYGGNSGKTGGYAGSIQPQTPGLELQGAVLNTSVAGGTGGYINLRGSNSGDGTETTNGYYRGVALTGTGNIIQSGGGNISITALGHGHAASQEAIAITDSGAKIIAGAGTITLTADTMGLNGKFGTVGDSGILNIRPLTSSMSIGVGTNVSGALNIASSVFSSVIQPGIGVVIGGSNSTGLTDGTAGTITVGTISLTNDLTLQAPGVSSSPATTGSIVISGQVSSSKNITLNAVQGAVTSSSGGITTTGGLEVIDPNHTALFDLSQGTNSVGKLAANTGQLIYSGSGPTAIDTVGSTSGITLSSSAGGTVNLSSGSLTVNQGVQTTVASAPLALSAAGSLTVNGAHISTNNGALGLRGAILRTTGVSSLAAGSGAITLTGDSMAFSGSPGGTTVSGTGTLQVQPLTVSKAVNVGGATGSGLNLAGSLFDGSPVFQDGFSSITIGQDAGSGIVTVDGTVTFHDPVVLQSPSGGTVALATTANLNNAATDQNITVKAGTFQTVSGGGMDAGSGGIVIEAGALNVPGGSVRGTGTIEIHPQNAGDSIALGSGTGGLILPTAAFSGSGASRVFQDGFSQIIVGRSDGSGSLSVGAAGITFTDKTLLQSPLAGGSLFINGPLATGSNYLTMNLGDNASQNSAGVITAAGMELLGRDTGYGPKTIYDFTGAANQIGTIAAATVNQVLVTNATSLTAGTVNSTSGVKANRLYDANGNTISVDAVNLESGGTLTVAQTISSTGGGMITLTADKMDFSTGTPVVRGTGNLTIQPLNAATPIDIGSFTANPAHLQLASAIFGGNIVKDGFNSVTIGRGNTPGPASFGSITLDGTVTFVDSTTIQSPNNTTPGTIQLAKTAHIITTGGSSLSLTAGTISADTSDTANRAAITASGDVQLTADVMTLGDGDTNPGSANIQGTGNTLYLRPFASSTVVDLGTDFTAGTANHLQFGDKMFNGAEKVFSGFGGYTIGGNSTQDITVTNTAHFAGGLALEGISLDAAANSTIDPSGSVRLQANTMNFGSLAHVTGTGSLQLHPYSSSTGMVVGDISGASAATNLLIPNGYFDGNSTDRPEGTTGFSGTARVFTGSYTNSITFGSTYSAQSVTMNNALFPSTDNITIAAISSGNVDIKGTIAANQNINVWGGTITTESGAQLSSSNGDITLSGHTFALNSGGKSITGTHGLFLQPFDSGESIGVGTDSGYDLNLPQNLFYDGTTNKTGALNTDTGGFAKVTIGRSDGSGNITVTNTGLILHTDLDVLTSSNSTGGKIHVNASLSDAGQTITMNASGGADQTAEGVITAANLDLLGGSSANKQVNYNFGTASNAVGVLAANVGSLNFHNGADLTVGTVNGTQGITATYAQTGSGAVQSSGDIVVASDGSLTVAQPVTSVNGANNLTNGVSTAISLQAGGTLRTTGSSAVISMTGATPSGNITLTADVMSLDSASRVKGSGVLNVRPLRPATGVGIGGGGGNSLELPGSLFSGGAQTFADGFTMLNLGHGSGTGTVTVDNAVTFTDPVTIQSPSGGTVVIGNGTTGGIDNSVTSQPITINAGTITTKANSLVSGGSGAVTLAGSAMDFSNGGSITGTGTLNLQAQDTTTRIALGTGGSGGLQIDSPTFNNVVSTTFNNITVGRSDGSNPIVVNTFTSPDKLILESPLSGGSVTVSGTLTMGGKDLDITSFGKIDGSTGTLTGVGTLTAVSTQSAIDFSHSTTDSVSKVTTFYNTIHTLGTSSAYTGITIGAAGCLTVNGQISDNTANDNTSAAQPVLIRTSGDLTLASGAQITTGGAADIYLSAEGLYKHFYNNSGRTAQNPALNPGSGRWLVYSYSPIDDKSIDSAQSSATDVIGNLTRDYKYYGYTFNADAPASVAPLPIAPAGSKRAFLYAYAPFLTPTAATRTYGYDNPTIQFTFAGYIDSDTSASLGITQTQNIQTSADINTNAGTYADNNTLYQVKTTDQTVTPMGYIIKGSTTVPLTIKQRPITVKADDAAKVYDGTSTAPTNWHAGTDYTVTSGSFYNTDTAASIITGQLAFQGTYTNAGTYTSGIGNGTLSGGTNYIVTVDPGTYTIYKRPITVTSGTITAASKVYDATTAAVIYGGGATLTGVVPSDSANVTVALPSQGVFVDKNAAVGKTVYIQGLTLGGSAAGNYSLSNANTYTTTADITPRPIGIQAGSGSKTYGDANSTVTYDSSGKFSQVAVGQTVDGKSMMSMAGGEKISDVTNTFYTDGATHSSQVTDTTDHGSYTVASTAPVFANGGIAGNYEIHYLDGTLAINLRPITITAASSSKTYGDSNPTVSGFTVAANGVGTSRGMAGTDNISSVTNTLHTGGTTDNSIVEKTGIGTYLVTPSAASFSSGSSGNYVITYADGAFVINKRALTVTPDNATKVYGEFDPGLSYVSLNTATGEEVTGTMSRVAGETVNNYAFSVANIKVRDSVSLVDTTANYTITSTVANFAITKRPITVTASTASKVYDGTNAATKGEVPTITSGSLASKRVVDTATYSETYNSKDVLTATTMNPLIAISSGNSNYNITYITAPGSITARPLTITAADSSKVYGDSNPTITGFTVTAPGVGTGLAGSEKVIGVTNSIWTDASHTAAVDKTTDVGSTYKVTSSAATFGSGGIASNYTINYVDGPFTINQRPLTITAYSQTRHYGDPNDSFGYTVALDGTGTSRGLVNGNTVTGVTITPGASFDTSTSAGSSTSLTPSAAVFGSGSIGNYDITYTNGTLSVDKRPLTITAGGASRLYGDNNPTVTAFTAATGAVGSGSGLVNGDSVTSVTDTVNAALNTGVGTASITPSAAHFSSGTIDNYTISYVDGTLTINQRPLTITADNITRHYGDTNPTFTATALTGTAGSGSGLVNGDTVGSVTVNASQVLDTHSGAGSTAVLTPSGQTFSNGSSGNYTISYAPGTLTVDQRPTTITADPNQHKTYGQSDPTAYTYTATNLVNSDSFSGALTRDSGENVSSYAINRGTLDNPNYAITYVGNPFIIDKAALTITADSKTRIYGDANPALTASYSGLTNGDSASVVTGLSLATPATVTSNVGPYAISGSGAAASNYTISYVDGTLTVSQRPLVITADNITRHYGDTNPAFTAAASTGTAGSGLGLVNGDTVGSVTVNASQVLDTHSGAGSTAALTPSGQTFSSGSSGNYLISYASGTLTVDQRPTTITADPNQHKTYGQSDPTAYTYTATNLVNSDSFSGALTRDSGENADHYAINRGTLDNPNYAITYVGNTFTIDKAALTITADSKSRIYGDANPALTASYNGFQYSDSNSVISGLSLATPATATSNVGSYAISGSGAAASNYTISYVPGDLTVTQRPTTVTVDAGQHKTYGESDPAAYTYTATNLVNSDSFSGALTRVSGENAGSYGINQGTLNNPNYAITYIENPFTIDKAPLTITADSKTRLYGDANPDWTFSYSGFKNKEGASVLSGLTAGTAAGSASNVGTYDIVPGGATAANYALSYQNGALTITPATLTYVADAATRNIGLPNPGFTGTVTGFKNGETVSSATGGSLSFDSPATATSSIGKYAIDGSGLSANFGNYVFQQDPGNATALSITGLPQPAKDATGNASNPGNQGGKSPTPGNQGGTSPGQGNSSNTGPSINFGPGSSGSVTVNFGSVGADGNKQTDDFGDLTPRKEGISIPVFTRNSSGVNAEGLYDVSYNQSSLTVIPSGQNAPPPPALEGDAGPAAIFDMKVGNTTSSFSVQALNGVLRITPLGDASKQIIQSGDKAANKLILANGILSAVNELGVVPDQVLAVFIMNDR